MLADPGGVVYLFFCLINTLCVFEDRVVIASSFFGISFWKNLLFHLSCARGLFHDEPGLKFTF